MDHLQASSCISTFQRCGIQPINMQLISYIQYVGSQAWPEVAFLHKEVLLKHYGVLLLIFIICLMTFAIEDEGVQILFKWWHALYFSLSLSDLLHGCYYPNYSPALHPSVKDTLLALLTLFLSLSASTRSN